MAKAVFSKTERNNNQNVPFFQNNPLFIQQSYSTSSNFTFEISFKFRKQIKKLHKAKCSVYVGAALVQTCVSWKTLD